MSKVLIVDDEFSLGRVIQKLLSSKLNSKVLYIQDSLRALSYCEGNNDVSVVVTDINMPRLNGFELIRKLKEHDDNLIIYAMSGDYTNKEQALSLGAQGFFKKGVTLFDELMKELSIY